MKREILKKNTSLFLKTKSGETVNYFIENVALKGDFGTSCICYKASRIKDGVKEKDVLLKQFNPIGNQSERVDFEKAVKIIQQLLNNAETKDYICADSDIEVLYDETTIYCENQYHKSFISWKDLSQQKGIRIYELLQTANVVIRFLEKLHCLGWAYMDLKPEDILIPIDEMGNIMFTQPLFFDFNSCVEINRRHTTSVVRKYTTEQYRANIFSNYSLEEIEIDISVENEMFANVLESLVGSTKYQTVSKQVKARLKKLFDELRKPTDLIWSEKQIEMELKEIKEQILQEEHRADDKRLKTKTEIFNVVRIFILVLTIMGHISITIRLVNLCFTDGIGYNYEWLIREVFAVLFFILILMGLKLLYWWLAERIANYYISSKSYQERTNTSEYYVFRRGFRVNTTFQDKNECNQRRQRRRIVLWTILFVALVSSFVISIAINSFVIFLELGFLILIAFMYADFIPSRNEFYNLYMKSNNEKRNINGKTLFYQDEYRRTDGTFDLTKEFYTKNNRNLFTLRKQILDVCFDVSAIENLSWCEKAKCLFDYDYRVETMKKYKERNMDLGYDSLQIQHIYKMAFDRVRNRQLIVIISSTVIILAILGLDFAQYFESVNAYFAFPQELYLGITLGLNIFILIISIYQVLCILSEEMLVSALAYKSKYMLDENLIEQLVIDIAAGIIKKIDVARGTWQYDGYINTTPNFRMRRALRMYEFSYNRPLFHHTAITNSPRLAITVWLLFGVLFAFLVLQLQYFFLTPILILMTAVIHYLLHKYLLPVLGKKKLIREIEKLNKYSEN